jgi:hypothetical protein
MQRYLGNFVKFIMVRCSMLVLNHEDFFLYPASLGALTQLYAGTSPDLTMADSGRYFIPWARPGVPRKGMQDVDLAMKLWDFLDKETSGKY